MKYFPVNLDLHGRQVVVIGGGSVAARKVQSLLEAGAEVRVIAPEIDPLLNQWGGEGKIELDRRGYQRGDLEKAFAAIAATDDRELNLRIREEALKEKVLLNIVDKPEFCDFVFPSKVERGEFLLTISTGGASPALSKKIREDLEKSFGQEYGDLVDLLGRIRRQIAPADRKKYEKTFSDFVRSPILEALQHQDRRKVRELVSLHFGEKMVLE